MKKTKIITKFLALLKYNQSASLDYLRILNILEDLDYFQGIDFVEDIVSFEYLNYGSLWFGLNNPLYKLRLEWFEILHKRFCH